LTSPLNLEGVQTKKFTAFTNKAMDRFYNLNFFKMERIITILFLFICNSISLNAQSSEKDKFLVQMSAGYTPVKDIYTAGIFGNAKTGFTQLSYNPSKAIYLQKLDAKGSLLKTETRGSIPREFSSVYEVFTFGNGKSCFLNGKLGGDFANEAFEINDINTDKSAIALDILEKNYTYSSLRTGKMDETTTLIYRYSKDKTKVLIAYHLVPMGRGAASKPEKLGYWVVDENMQKVAEKKIDIPFDRENTEYRDFAVDNNGSPYVLLRITETPDKKEKRGTKPRIHFELYNLKDLSTKILIPNDGKYIEDLALNNANDGTIIVAGLYSNTNTSKGSNGVVVYKLNTTTNSIAKLSNGFIEFPTSLIEKFEFARTKSKAEKAESKGVSVGIANLFLRELEVKTDGSMLVSGEQFWIKELTSSSGESMGTLQHYEDVFAMRIQTDGTIAWSQKIPKFQKGSAEIGSMSFHHETFNNEDYFFYVDNVKNLDLPIDNEPHTHADGMGGILTYFRIDEKGNMQKGHIFDLREKDINIAPTDFVRIDENAMRCIVQFGKTQKKILILRLK
jgi:hypothetical protein